MSTAGSATSDRPHVAIHPDTSIGTVRLAVSDVDRSRAFYEHALGLRSQDQDDGTLAFGVPGERPLLELRSDSSAPRLDRGATGLYHLAILMPGRVELAFALARLAEFHWPLDGASDHLVSEALYLSDPDGNGIEIYRDRPREEWRRVDGQLAMSTLPLDVRSVLAEIADASSVSAQAPTETRIGHVHLQVSDLDEAEEFYSGVLRFDVVVRGYPGALFVSAGGYHHHIGLNTWHSLRADPPPAGAIGLRSFEIALPDDDELRRVVARVRAAGIEVERGDEGSLIRDPSGNGILLVAG